MSPYKVSKVEESVRVALAFIECMNGKDISLLGDMMSPDCSYDDLWEEAGRLKGKSDVVRYIEGQFEKFARMRMVVTDAKNSFHACVVRYRCYGLGDDAERGIDCVGIFEVRNRLVSAVSLFCKR